MSLPELEADVLVVGAGPVGLSLAMDLVSRGVRVAIAEIRRYAEPPNVKCNHVSARTMERFRRLGVAARLRDAGLPADYPNDVVFRTSVCGQELTRIPIPCRAERYTSREGPDSWWPTPEPPHRINQMFMEPVLLEHTAALPGVTLLNRTQVTSLTQQPGRVEAIAHVRDRRPFHLAGAQPPESRRARVRFGRPRLGAQARAEVGAEAYALNVQQFCCGGLNFGYFYQGSPIVAADGEQPPPYTMGDFTESTMPGYTLLRLAPDAWPGAATRFRRTRRRWWSCCAAPAEGSHVAGLRSGQKETAMTPRLVLAALLAAAIAPLAHAQGYPAKPIRILVGSPPGGPSDIVTRLFAEHLSQRFKQPVVAENRPGVGNSLAAGVVAKGEADGYTLVISPDTVVTTNPLVYTRLNFDARTELVNVSVLANFTQMLVCHPGKGFRNAADLVERSKNTRMTYASGGPGVPGHLAAEMFLQSTGAKMEHVPYKGPAPATLSVLSGETDCGFLATPTVLPHVKAGKLAALAVSSIETSPLAPEVPSLAKALNQPKLDITFKLVLQAAKGTPAPVVAELERAAMEIMKKPEVKARLLVSDLVAVGSSHAEAEAAMKAETARWTPLVKRLDIKAE